jgi:hypothetical protein
MALRRREPDGGFDAGGAASLWITTGDASIRPPSAAASGVAAGGLALRNTLISNAQPSGSSSSAFALK